jgi:hypothetical protein
MHILMLVVIGLVVLAGVASIINGAFGVMRVGIPIVNEIGAFVPIFGIPAALACYLAYRYHR